MKRFLLSLAILVMACGMSFGQGSPGGAGGTGSGSGGYAAQGGYMGTGVGLHQGGFITPSQMASDPDLQPLTDPIFQGYAVDSNATFGSFILPVRSAYPSFVYQPTDDSSQPHSEIFLFGFPEMVPENNPAVIAANTHNATIYQQCRNMRESKAEADWTPTDNKILALVSYKTFVAGNDQEAVDHGVEQMRIAHTHAYNYYKTNHVDGVSWTDPDTGEVHVPRIYDVTYESLTRDSPTSIVTHQRCEVTGLANGWIKVEGHVCFFLEWPTIQGVGNDNN